MLRQKYVARCHTLPPYKYVLHSNGVGGDCRAVPCLTTLGTSGS